MNCVDVIIPFYKETEQLHSAVKSCLLPGNAEYITHILLVCDGSEEVFSWAIENVLPLDKRIVLFKTNGKEGSGAARNVGLSESYSEYIAFLDADDIWLPNKLSQQLKELEVVSQAAACCTSYVISGAALVVPRKIYAKPLEIVKQLKIGTSTTLLRRSCVGELRFTSRKFSQDTEFWFNFVKNKNYIIGIPDCTCVYFPSPRTSNKISQLINFIRMNKDLDISSLSLLSVVFRYSVRGIINHFIARLTSKL